MTNCKNVKGIIQPLLLSCDRARHEDLFAFGHEKQYFINPVHYVWLNHTAKHWCIQMHFLASPHALFHSEKSLRSITPRKCWLYHCGTQALQQENRSFLTPRFEIKSCHRSVTYSSKIQKALRREEILWKMNLWTHLWPAMAHLSGNLP